MSTSANSQSIAGTILRLLVAALLWIALIIVLVVIVPQRKKHYDQLGLQLPVATQVVIDVSMWFADYWWEIVIFMAPVFVVATIVTYFVRHRSDRGTLVAFWTFLLLAPPILAQLIVWGALFLAQQKLLEGLSR
ncbi:MAG: hypothetical protein ACJ8F7_21915 [Gemmataceae bacterium]